MKRDITVKRRKFIGKINVHSQDFFPFSRDFQEDIQYLDCEFLWQWTMGHALWWVWGLMFCFSIDFLFIFFSGGLVVGLVVWFLNFDNVKFCFEEKVPLILVLHPPLYFGKIPSIGCFLFALTFGLATPTYHTTHCLKWFSYGWFWWTVYGCSFVLFSRLGGFLLLDGGFNECLLVGFLVRIVISWTLTWKVIKNQLNFSDLKDTR